MKILVTGVRGQVGNELMRQGSARDWNMVGTNREELDISERSEVEAMILAESPDVVINAAAYTAVDKAESEPDRAFSVNRDGAAHLAKVCADLNIPLVHFSTDYVFDGSKTEAYEEGDQVSPLGVYGESKLAGEQLVRRSCQNHLILRTSWVFSAHGNNFVKTMLRLGVERDTIGVVTDQYGKPTSATELARVTLEILPKLEGHWGTYHLAQPDATNWNRFARSIFEEAKAQGIKLKVAKVNAIATSDYPTPARRPANSELNCDKLESVFGIRIRPWRNSLREVVKELAHG